MATTIGNQITLDGTFTDWPTTEMIMTAANAVSGYQVFGALLDDATLGATYVIGVDATGASEPVIGAGSVIYLNADQNDTTGYSPFGAVGAEYEVQFALDSNNVLQAYLYAVTASGVTTLLNGGAPLDSGFSSDGESVELAIPQSLLTPAGGTAPAAIGFDVLLDNGSGGALPATFAAATPGYVIPDPSAAAAAATIAGTITLDGTFTDWPAGDMVMTSTNTVAGYQVFGALLSDATLGDTYVIGIEATSSSGTVIGAGSTIYLNTDQNSATGFSPFGSVGAEYEVQFSYGPNGVLQPYLYAVGSTGVTTLLNGGAPLPFGISSNGESVEVAIPRALLTPAGGTAPASIDFSAVINNGTAALPADFAADAEYTIADPAAAVSSAAAPVSPAVSTAATSVSAAVAISAAAVATPTVKKVGIVYSATTAALYFGGGSAGQTAYADLFMAAQHQAEAAGVSYDLLTEADLTNVAKLSQYSALIFPSFQDVQSSQASAIASALQQVVSTYHVPIITAGDFMTNDQTGAVLSSTPFASMQSILGVTNSSYGTATYSVTPDATALASNNPILSGYTPGQLIGGASGQFAGTTEGYYTNSGYEVFAGYGQTAKTIADINIQGGATVAGVVQATTGGTNTVFATTDLMGDSNLLQHVIQNAVFGTTPSLTIDITRFAGVVNSRTDMDQSQYPVDVSNGIYSALIPMLQQWEQQYDFVGSYYINIGNDANPTTGTGTNWAVSTPIYDQLLQMGNEIGDHSYTHLIAPPTVDANGNPVPSSNGVSTWDENTNTLYVTAPANGSAPNWTYSYEFGQSKTIEQQNLGITIAGGAVPGANDTVTTSQNILSYFPTTGGLTGYVSGGWTGVGSGSPNAFGYITPGNTSSVYIAPNITFDFTEVQYDNKTAAQALADWESLFDQLSANSEQPIIVWPWHDYGPTDWPTSGTTGPGYTEAMYQDFIAYAYNAGYEFVTSEELAQRIAAEQAATLSETTSGNVITATVTPAASQPDLGAMALNVVNGATGQVIQNAGSWYAYDTNSVFMPYAGGTFTVTLGATQDDVTHIDSLPMRADLKSVTGNGSNLTFAMTGDGTVDIHIKTPGGASDVVSIQTSATGTGAGTPTAKLVGDDLQLIFADAALAISASSPEGVPVLHNVTITEGSSAVAGATFVFATPVTTITTAGGLTNQASKTISGTVTEPVETQVAGTTVTLTDNGSKTALGTATVQANGSWSTTVALAQGLNSIVAKDTDLSGLTGASSAVVYTLDTQAPSVAITSAGGQTNKASQTISGTVTEILESAVAGTTVTLTDNGSTTALGTATVSSTGTWSTTVSLAQGANSIVAKDTDLAGNAGQSSAVAYTVNAQAPVVAITSTGGQTNNPSQTISGTVTETTESEVAGTTVTLTDNGSTTALGTATVQANGTWSTTVTLAQGANSIVAKDTDLAGNAGQSSAVVYTLDTQAPSVAITSAGGQTNNPSQTISGTVTETLESEVAGTTVTLTDNGSTTALGTATVQANGTWSTTVTLAQGPNSIVAKDTDLAGNAGQSSAVVYTVNAQGPVVAITSAGGQTSNPSQTISGTVTETTESEVAGTTVTLYDNGSTTALGTATVQANGTWSTTVSLAQGANSIVAKDTDLAGNAGQSSAVVYTVSGQTPSVTPYVSIASAGGQTKQPSLTISGAVREPVESAVAGTTVTLTDNGSAVGTAKVAANGTWSTTVALSEGANSIVAKDTDVAGAVGASSAVVYTFTPVKPAGVMTSASYAGSAATGQWSLAGTAAAGSTVTVYDGATALGAATATTGGTWSFKTAENESAIRVFSVTDTISGATSAASAPYYEGTPGNDVFSFASEAAVSTAALIYGSAGTDTLQMTSPATLSDADFGHVQAIEILGLNGAGSVSLGANASRAGVRTVITGAGATSVADSNSGTLTVNAAALGAGDLLTLTGSTAVTVTNLTGNLDASGDTGAITVTATGSGPHTIVTGGGKEAVTASGGGDTFQGAGGGDSFKVSGHTVADSFTFSETSDSPNTATGHDTITGFAASRSIQDLLDFSRLNANLAIEGPVTSGSTVAADSIAWLYSGGSAMVYVNDTGSALALDSASLMEITLAGLSRGLSASNFKV